MMNSLDDQIDRLFRAGGARSAGPFSAPYGMETRVLAAWRGAGSFGGWSPALLVRGLFAACAMMLLSLWPLFRETSANPTSDYLQLADSTLQSSDNP